MGTLNVDLITNILLRLPAKPLLSFKSVCKLWYDVISDPYFANCHLERSLATKSNLHFVITTPMLHLADFDTFENPVKLNYPFKRPDNGGVDIVGCCNGLICLWNCDTDLSLFLYNPTTQTHKLLPFCPITRPFDFAKSNFDFGFGYDRVAEDYKCVRILQNFDNGTGDFESEVMVYTMKGDAWRKGPNVPFYFRYHNGRSAFVENTIHWVGVDEERVPLPIVGFDLGDETFSSLPLPNFDAEEYCHMYVGVLDGCLCLSLSSVDDFELWVMEEYGMAGSWKILFNVVKRKMCESLEWPICYSMSGKDLFVRISLLQVAVIDVETLEIRDVKVADFRNCFDAYVCVENLHMLVDSSDDVVEENEEQPGKKDGKQDRKKRRKKNRRRN